MCEYHSEHVTRVFGSCYSLGVNRVRPYLEDDDSATCVYVVSTNNLIQCVQ